MFLFAHRQRLRLLAARVLLVWSFALATGFANACVVQVAAACAHAAASHEQLPPMASSAHDAGAHALHGAPGAHSPGGPHEGGSVPCAKFCSEPAASTQTFKQDLDLFAVLGLPATPAYVIAPGPIAASRVERRPGPAPWRHPVPIPIAYLRLAL